MRRLAIMLTVSLLTPVTTACGDDGGARFPPVRHAATAKECGTCHLVFPPQMLPARSWETMMGDLANHFGEDASLNDALRADITAYLTGNAADAKSTSDGGRYIRGIASSAAPLRITETPYWVRKHDEISERRFQDPKIKSKANCIACHKTADKGEYFEEEGDED